MNKPLTNILKYDKTLDIRNVDCLPHGLNAKYLEVMTSHELHNKLENFYQGFICGVKVNYDTCHECKHFTVRSGWGEYCIASEDFARTLTASLKSWGVLK